MTRLPGPRLGGRESDQGGALSRARILLVVALLAAASLLATAARAEAVGELTFDGCLNDDGSDNCGDLGGPANTSLTGAFSVAVSPDNGSVYVASSTENSISHFSRAPQGQIAFQGCSATTAPTTATTWEARRTRR